jgi:hypothetical protein
MPGSLSLLRCNSNKLLDASARVKIFFEIDMNIHVTVVESELFRVSCYGSAVIQNSANLME